MRLGIRRKLIGTLILVGLLPLAVSLALVLGGGAAVQLGRIRASYEDASARCAEHVSDALLHEELEKLALMARLPEIVQYVREHNSAPADPGPEERPVPQPSARDRELDADWSNIKESDPPLKAIMNNPAAMRLQTLVDVDGRPRRSLITDAAGRLIAADKKTGNYYQAGEDWWQAAFDQGRGRLYISSIVQDPAGSGLIVAIALPIYDQVNNRKVVIGVLKDKISVRWALASLHEVPLKSGINAHTQLIDLDLTGGPKTVYAIDNDAAAADRAERFYVAHRDVLDHPEVRRLPVLTLLRNDIVIGTTAVPLEARVPSMFEGARVPHWVVVVSKRSDEAMSPVYWVALTVALIGLALIVILFVLGVAISNREIIMPILRLREAIAAVGRGELNVRLLSTDSKDATFRKDELGDLAQDFDKMTKQLQRSVQELRQSNEAKQRFMDLASHELLTPVTFILGACPIAAKQSQQIAEATAASPALAPASRNASAVQTAVTRIESKTKRLARIIQNLLKLVASNQFTARLDRQPVDMRALILQVAAEHRAFLAERKQQLTLDVPENLPSIDADRDKLEDVLTNLLTNAIRFSPDGSTLRIAARLAEGGGNLEILVEDAGPGISEKDLADLFQPMFTGSDISRQFSGTVEFQTRGMGLGLAIVRRFVELHDGVVRASIMKRDDKTVGTQFQILLPLNRPAEGTAGEPSRPAAPPLRAPDSVAPQETPH